MRWLSQLRLRARSLFRKRQADGELSDELQFHLDGRADELVADGMTPEQARRLARRELGTLALIEEDCRDARRVNYIEQTIRDARYGLRSLIRSPGFATMAIVTLALGIGANTAIFSAVDAVLLRPLPYPAADELVIVWEEATRMGIPAQYAVARQLPRLEGTEPRVRGHGGHALRRREPHGQRRP